MKVSHTGIKAMCFADSCLRRLLPAVVDTSEIKMRTQTLLSFLGKYMSLKNRVQDKIT